MMADIVKWSRHTIVGARQVPERNQLKLPFDKKDFSWRLVFCFDDDVSPSTLSHITTLEGTSCIADLRQIPFFSGDNQRHSKIIDILFKEEIPIFHLGSALRQFIDQGMPERVQKSQLISFLNNTDSIYNKIYKYLEVGSSLVIIDKNIETIKISHLVLYCILNTYDKSHVKMNEAYSFMMRDEYVF